MLNTVHTDALNLLNGGWKPEDYEQIKEEYNLTDDETSEICDEMNRIIEYRADEKDVFDMLYREARDAGKLNWK